MTNGRSIADCQIAPPDADRSSVQPMQLAREERRRRLVGLEIEAGSIAAAEVRGQRLDASVTATAIGAARPRRLPRRRGRRPRRPRRRPCARSSPSNKLCQRVRLGIANQRVVVRTLRLPAIEDPKELDAAVRFQAQEQIPMPIDQAVLDHRVVGGVAADDEDAGRRST